MATYSDHAQRELDASDIAAEVVPFKPARRLPNVTVPRETELDDEIKEAIYDSCDEDGWSAYNLRRELAKRGLVIVDAARLGRMKLAVQLFNSVTAEFCKTET